MKSFFNYALLACFVVLFILPDRAMGGEWLGDNCYWSDIQRGGWKAVYYKDKGKWIWEDHSPRVFGPGRNQRVQPKPSDRLLPTTPPQQPSRQTQQQEQNTFQSRGATVVPTKPSPTPAQVQPSIQAPSQPLPPRVYSPPERPASQMHTLVVQHLQIYSGFGQRLRLGVGVQEHSGDGVLVTDVLENSPANIAGLAVGDVILEINRMPINDLIDYSYAVDRSSETMEMKVSNEGQEFMLTIELRY